MIVSTYPPLCKQWLGRFVGIIGWEPSVCKSNRLHVDILRFSFIKLGVYSSINSSKVIGNFLQSWTSTGYFSNWTGSSETNCRFSPIIVWQVSMTFLFVLQVADCLLVFAAKNDTRFVPNMRLFWQGTPSDTQSNPWAEPKVLFLIVFTFIIQNLHWCGIIILQETKLQEFHYTDFL
jgi:hypothetical protein